MCHRALLSTVGGGEAAPRASALGELGAWTSDRERAAMVIERDADDIARCFALEQVLYEEGFDRTFGGEVSGLIGAGAFVVFSVDDPDDAASTPPYEGMLPVRRMQGIVPASREPQAGAGGRAAAAGRSAGARSTRAGTGSGRGGPGRGRGGPEGAPAERDWWELNEEGTILHGSRSGAALRLGDAVHVRVQRVDTVRGRVDLGP